MPSITNYHNENISQSERDANSASVAATDYVSLAEDYSRRMERSVMQVLHHNDSDYLNPDERLITAVRYHGIIDGKPMFDLYDADNERFTTMSQEDIEDIVDPVGLKTAAVQEQVLHRSSDMFNAISATENVEPFIIEQMEYIGNPVLALNPRVRLSDADGSRNITVGILDFYNVTKTITPAVQEQGEEQALFDINSAAGVLTTSSGYEKINRFLEDHSGDITAFRAIDDKDSSMRGYEFYGHDVKEITDIFPEFADSVRTGRFPDGKMMDYLFISNDDMRERFVPLVQSLPESIGITITDSPRQMGTALEEVSIPSRDTLGTLLSAGSIAEMIADEYSHWKEAVVYSYDELNAMAQRYTEVFHGKSIPLALADETFYSYDRHFAGYTVNSVVPQIDRNLWDDSIRGFLDVPTFDFYATNGDLIHTFSKKEIDAIIDPVDLENRRSDIVGSNITRFFPNQQPFVIDEVDYFIANGLVDTTENNVVFRSNTGPDRGEMWEEVNHFNYLYENVIDRERKDADEALAVEAVARLQGAIMEDEEGPFVVANVEYKADSEYFIISGDNDKGYILADSSYIRELLSPSTHLSYSTESAMNEENIRDEHHEDTHRVVSAEERREAGEDMISRQQIAYPQQTDAEDIKRGDNISSANVLQRTYVVAGLDLTKVDSNDLRHWNDNNLLGYGTALPSSFRRAMDKVADDLDRKVNRAIGNNRRDRPSLFDKITPHYSIENGQLAVTFPVKSTLNGGTFEEEEERFGVLRLVYDLTDEGGAKALTLADATSEANRPTFSYEQDPDSTQQWNHQLLLDPREDYEALLSTITKAAMLSMVATELRDGLGYDATINPSTGKVNVSIETIGTVTTKTPVVVDVSYYEDTDLISSIDARMSLVGDKNNDGVDVSAIVGSSLEAHYRINGMYDPMKPESNVITPIQEAYSKAVYGELRLRDVQAQYDKPFKDLYQITRNLTEGQKIGVIEGGEYYEMKVTDVVAAGPDESGREQYDIIGRRQLVYNERTKSNEYVEDHALRVSADVLRQLLDNRYNANVQELRGGEAGQPPLTIVVDAQEQDRLFIASKMKESLIWRDEQNIYDLSQYTAEHPVMHESSVDNKDKRTPIRNLARIASLLRSNANRIRVYAEITPIERVASLLRKNLDVVGKDYNYTVLPRRASDGNASLRLLAPHIDTPIQLRYEGDEVRGTGRLIASVDLYDTGRRFVQTAYDIANDKDIDEESLVAFVRETINAYHREKMAISLQETYRNNLVEIDNGTLYVPRNSMPGSRNQPPFVLDVDYGIDNLIEKVTITLPAYDQQEVDRDADAVEQNITYVQEYDGDDRERIGYEQIKQYIEQILSDYAAKRQVEKFTSIPLGRPVEDYLNVAKANGDAITIFHRAVDDVYFIIGEHAGNDSSLGATLGFKHGVVGTIASTADNVPVAIEFFDGLSLNSYGKSSVYDITARGLDVAVYGWPPTDSAQTSIRFLATPQTMQDFAVGAYGRNLASDTIIVIADDRDTYLSPAYCNVSILFSNPEISNEFQGNLCNLDNGLYSISYGAPSEGVDHTMRNLQAKGYNVIELYHGYSDKRSMASADDKRIVRVGVSQYKKADRRMLESIPQTEEEMINRIIANKALSFQQAAYDNTTDRWISAFRDNSTTAVVSSVALRDDNDDALVTFNDGTTRSVDKYNLINAIFEGQSTIPVKGVSADSNISHYEHIISENSDIVSYTRDLSSLIASRDVSMVFPGDEQPTKIEKVYFSATPAKAAKKGINVGLNYRDDRLTVPYDEFVKLANEVIEKDKMRSMNTLYDLYANVFDGFEYAGKVIDVKQNIEDGQGKIRALLSDGYDIELTVHFSDKQSADPSRMDVTRIEERVTRVGGTELRTGHNFTAEENAAPSMRDERVLDSVTQLMTDLRAEATDREALLSSAAARIAVATGNAQGVEIHCDNSRNEVRLPYDDALEFYVTFDFREDNSVRYVSVETEAKDKDISTFLRRNATDRYYSDEGAEFDTTEVTRYIATMLSEYRRAMDFKNAYTNDIRLQQEGEMESIKSSLLNHAFIRGRVNEDNIFVVNDIPRGGNEQKLMMMLDNGLTVDVNVIRDDDFKTLTDVIVSGKYSGSENSTIVGGEIEKSMNKEALSQYSTIPSAYEVAMGLSEELFKELSAVEEQRSATEQTAEDSIVVAKQQWASSLATALSQAAEAGDGVWLNGGYKQQPAIYPKMTKVGPFNSMLLALHSDKENTPTNVYMFYTGAHYSATPIREGEKGVTLAISKGDHRELRGLFNITQTLMSERAKSMKDYDRVIARYSGGDKALAAREAARQTTADSYIAMLRGGLVNVEYNGSSIPHYDTDKDTLYLPPVGNRDERVYLEEVVRCAIAATGAPQRLNRPGWDATLAADGESYEMLVREVATGVKLMELGYPGVLSSRAQVLVPEWCRELRENPALIDKLFRDVNRAVNMLHDVERGKIVNMQHMSVPMPDSQRDDKQEKTAGEAVDAAAQRKYIVQDLRKRVNTDQCFMVIVADKAAGHADVLLPQGASPTMLFNDGEMGEKDFIRQQLANEGITDVSFFNPTGAYGYDKNDIYFQGKEVYTAMLTRSAMERIADLDVSANVALAEMPIFEKIQMVRDDDNKWAMALKAKGQEPFLVYPTKEDIGRFFTTVKENPPMTDAVRMQLGRKYYGLTAPNAATDRHPLIAADTSGIDMSLIKKVQLFKTQKGEFLCRLTGADGMPPLQAQYVSAGQWQRMWLAADKDEYKSLLAAKLFGDVLREQTAQRAEQVQRTLAELQSKQSKTVSSALSSTTQQEKGVDAPAVQSVIQQYHSLKEKHPEAVLLFRCGSTVDGAAQYYEMFLDDAKKGAEVLGLPITTMTDKRYGEVSVVRFPHDDLDVNLLQLIRHGNRVAVVEALDKQPMRGLGDNKAIAPISRAGYEEVSVVLNGQTFAWRDLNGDGDIDGNEIRVERVALSADQRFIAIAGTDPASGEELSATVTAKELYDKLHALHPSRSLCAADLAGEKMTPVTGNGVWYNNIGEYTFNEPAMKGWAECAKEDSPLRVNTPKGGVVEVFSEYDSFDDDYTYRIADGGSVTTYDNFSAFRDGLSQRGIEFIGMRVYDTKDVATEEAATQGEAQQGSRSEGALRPNANDVLLVEKFVGRTVEYDAGDKMLRFAIEDVDGVNDEVLLAVDDDKKTMDMVSVATAAAMIADGRWRIVEQAQATVDVASLHDDENTTAVAVAQALSSQVHSTDVKFIEATLRGETLTLRHPLDAEEADFSHILYADPDRKDPDVVTLIAKNGDKLILDKESVLESMFSNGKPSTLDFAFTGDVPEKIATYNELLNDALAGERVTFSDGEKGQVEEVELFLEDGELLVDVETKEQGEHVMPYNDFTSSVYVIVARTAEEEVNIRNDKANEVVSNNDVSNNVLSNNDISSPYVQDDKTYVTVSYKGEQWQCRQVNDIDDEPLIIASSDLLDTLAPREMQGEDLSFADTAAEELYDRIFYFTSDKDALSLSDDALTAVMAKEHPDYFVTTQRPAILQLFAAELKVLDKGGHSNAIVFVQHDTSYRAYGDDVERVQAIKPEVKVSSVMQADGSRISMAEIPVFCMDRFQKEAALKGVDVATLNIKADDTIVDGKLVAKRNATVEVMPKVDSDIAAVIRDRQEVQRMLTAQLGLADRNSKQRYSYETGKSNFNYSYKIDLGNGYTLQGKEEFSRKNSREAFVSDGLRLTLCSDRGYEPLTAAAALKADDPQLAVKVRWLIEGYAEGLKLPQEESPEQVGESAKQQYSTAIYDEMQAIKNENGQDIVVMFRGEELVEMYGRDAEVANNVLHVPVEFSKEQGTPNGRPMLVAIFPMDRVKGYVERLQQQSHGVAVWNLPREVIKERNEKQDANNNEELDMQQHRSRRR